MKITEIRSFLVDRYLLILHIFYYMKLGMH